ncbi:MAG: DUF1858 domain-containing protein [Bacteroidetes bacterium]|jgi:virulence-associated protein VapD|nr:DUF1858 domain-containing protein [Bacteroidota bacterium]MBT5531378.1 DUF1858 domain-containing protein [Cytophagia bacterium]MBT3424070.1 DUF1858 domain-containing protein [Bacteroidota bacterium]MBT3802620.1 DUF1858 domain-containing protein [Bacteroidota bacterium]MBT3934477.1 DUF1858 domain-containing protein [Bacteroidota bacterium]
MQITEKTKVSAILKEYGDIAEVMETFGLKRVGGLGLRKFISKFISVKTAAKVHKVPLDKLLNILNEAVVNNSLERQEKPDSK